MSDLQKFTIVSTSGLKAELTNYGARLMSLFVPDRNDKAINVNLGFKEAEDYFFTNEKYFGAVVGRFCNRIGNATFTLDGIQYNLEKNMPPHHLHGGINAFHNVLWDAKKLSENAIEFVYRSKDMEEGYPGNLDVRLIYALVDNELHFTAQAISDKRTVVNLTLHPYFNLNGEGSGNILDHELMINADHYTPVDDSVITTGEIFNVEGSPFDFRNFKKVGRDINLDHPQLKIGHGYDHNFVIKKAIPLQLDHAATVKSPKSGITMEVHTTEPGLQLYTSNWLDGKDIGYSGNNYEARSAFCLEPQHFPDSPNKSHFPSTILEIGEKYHTRTVLKFSV